METSNIPNKPVFPQLSPMKRETVSGFGVVGPLKQAEIQRLVNGYVYKIYETDMIGNETGGEWRLEIARSGEIINFERSRTNENVAKRESSGSEGSTISAT